MEEIYIGFSEWDEFRQSILKGEKQGLYSEKLFWEKRKAAEKLYNEALKLPQGAKRTQIEDNAYYLFWEASQRRILGSNEPLISHHLRNRKIVKPGTTISNSTQTVTRQHKLFIPGYIRNDNTNKYVYYTYVDIIKDETIKGKKVKIISNKFVKYLKNPYFIDEFVDSSDKDKYKEVTLENVYDVTSLSNNEIIRYYEVYFEDGTFETFQEGEYYFI